MRFLFVVHKNEEKAEQNSVLFHRLTLKERGLRPNGYFPLMRQPLLFLMRFGQNDITLCMIIHFFPTAVGSKAAKARRAYGRKAQSSRSRGKAQRVAAGAWQGAQKAALLSRLLSLRCQQWGYFSPSCFSQFRVFPVRHPRCGLLQDLPQDQPFVHLRASRLKRAH